MNDMATGSYSVKGESSYLVHQKALEDSVLSCCPWERYALVGQLILTKLPTHHSKPEIPAHGLWSMA